MNYISISLYRKVIEHALSEGMTLEDFKGFPIPVESINEIQAVPADHFLAARNAGPEPGIGFFSVRVVSK